MVQGSVTLTSGSDASVISSLVASGLSSSGFIIIESSVDVYNGDNIESRPPVNIGMIVGIVIGVVAFVAIAVGVGVAIYKCKNQPTNENNLSDN